MIAIVAVVCFVVIYLAARRFERVQRRKGRWDAYGPIHPTKGPTTGYGMYERLEVTGQYEPRPIPRELPPEHEHEHKHKQVD